MKGPGSCYRQRSRTKWWNIGSTSRAADRFRPSGHRAKWSPPGTRTSDRGWTDKGSSAADSAARWPEVYCAILPPYMRRVPSIDALIPALYLKGISTGDFTEALTAILGERASEKYTEPSKAEQSEPSQLAHFQESLSVTVTTRLVATFTDQISFVQYAVCESAPLSSGSPAPPDPKNP